MLVHHCLLADQLSRASFSAGISLLVPHGGIAEDTTWEMYMSINQEDSRLGTLTEEAPSASQAVLF